MGLCGNCIAWQDGTRAMYQADPDIAGIGIISAYVGSAAITLCLSAAHIVLTISDSQERNSFDGLVYKAVKSLGLFQIANTNQNFWVPVIQKLILNLSDQQLLTGLAVLIAGFWTHCSISVYHFAFVNDLAWMSSSVHLTTLFVLRDYLCKNQKLRDWRVFLMVAMAILLVASTIMEGHYEWYDSWPYGAQCLFDDLIGNVGGSPGYWMGVGLALITLYYARSVIPLFEAPTEFFNLWFKTRPRDALDHVAQSLNDKKSHITAPNSTRARIQRNSTTLLMMCVSTIGWLYFALLTLLSSQICGLALDLFWFAYSLWGLIEDRKIPPSEMDGNENTMTFGQIVPILLLSSIVLVFREAYDEMKEVENKSNSLSHSSQLSLVRTRSSAAAASQSVEMADTIQDRLSLVRTRSSAAAGSMASQSFEMTGAIQDAEDDVEPEVSPPRRVDTEMGGRSQASGLEGGSPGLETQRRSTFPPWEINHRL